MVQFKRKREIVYLMLKGTGGWSRSTSLTTCFWYLCYPIHHSHDIALVYLRGPFSWDGIDRCHILLELLDLHIAGHSVGA